MSDLLAFEADRRAVNITINRYSSTVHNFFFNGFSLLILPIFSLWFPPGLSPLCSKH
jgi:hypothetical protein